MEDIEEVVCDPDAIEAFSTELGQRMAGGGDMVSAAGLLAKFLHAADARATGNFAASGDRLLEMWETSKIGTYMPRGF